MKRIWAAAMAGLLALPLQAAGVDPLPSFQAVLQAYRASDVLVLDRSGQLLQRVRSNYEGRRGDWLKLDAISPALQKAVIESEDRRFYTHNGVDWRSIASAAWNKVFGTGQRGASTLTMQLAGLVDGGHQRPAGGRGVLQKVDQAIYAQALERRWSKQQVLEAYLNLVPFRGEIIGVDALSRVLFQKHASGLDARESALAAAMLRAPNAPVEVLARRTCALLQQIREEADCGTLGPFITASLRNRSAPRSDSHELAPHFARWVVSSEAPGPGQSLRTSIDADLQRRVLRIVDRRLHELLGTNLRDAAVVVLDNKSGEILAYVGASGRWSEAVWVDHAKARRQAGSTLKPFLYQQAVEQQRLTSVSLLNDSPLNLPTGNGLYIPQNYDEQFSGWVSMRVALASSLNIPAVRALTMVTPDAFRERLVALGLPLDQSGDFYGYSLALGSADVTLLSLTNAYRSLANLGWYSSVRLLPGNQSARGGRQVMDSSASWIIGDVLSDPHARARTFGLFGPLTTPFWTAVKTGTSKDMRDNWTVGWSERYTVGVWAGNSAGASMRDVSGVTGAGPIWHDVMAYLHAGVGSVQLPMPRGVSPGRVSFQENIEPSRTDYFVGDTVQEQVQWTGQTQFESKASAYIASPANGTILALDPDIPPLNQRLLLSASVAGDEAAGPLSWRVGGQYLGADAQILWMPMPGKHRVELLGEDGKLLDSVTVTVRGATEKAGSPRTY